MKTDKLKENSNVRVFRGRLASGNTVPNPLIQHHFPDAPSTDIAIIIFAGGGYHKRSSHEGPGYAEFLAKAGIHAFVVEYRIGSEGHRHPAMLEDALAAINTIRTQAAEFGIHSGKIGVMGSSAGGHLAAHALTCWHQYPSEISLRPDFGILCYPVITANPDHAHAGSFKNLLGDAPSNAQVTEVSLEKQVSAQTPPCFLWHTGEDKPVPMENSLLFAQALRRYDIPFEMHIYPDGEHGLGLDTPFDWATPCLHWIKKTCKHR